MLGNLRVYTRTFCACVRTLGIYADARDHSFGFRYERFAQQNLAQIGATLVSEYSNGGGGDGDVGGSPGKEKAAKRGERRGSTSGGETIESNIAALEELEAEMRAA